MMITSNFLRLGFTGMIVMLLGACSTTSALVEAPNYDMDAGLVAQLDQLKVGGTRRAAVFGIMGKAADRVGSESGQVAEYYTFEQAANTANPLVAVRSMITNNYGTTTECRLSFDRRDILSTKTCTMRQAGLAGDGAARIVYPTQGGQQARQVAEVAHPAPPAPAASRTSCAKGETALIIKSIKKQKDKSLEVTYRNSSGVGHIPPEAGPFYKELARKKAGDAVCLDADES